MKFFIFTLILLSSYSSFAQDACAKISDDGAWDLSDLDTQKVDSAKAAKCNFNENRQCTQPRWHHKVPALVCAMFLGGDNSKFLTALIESGADVNAKDEKGLTPIQNSIEMSPRYLRLLMDAGADTTIKDKNGKGLVYYTHLKYKRVEELELLVDNFDRTDLCEFDLKTLKDFNGLAQAHKYERSEMGSNKKVEVKKKWDIARALLAIYSVDADYKKKCDKKSVAVKQEEIKIRGDAKDSARANELKPLINNFEREDLCKQTLRTLKDFKVIADAQKLDFLDKMENDPKKEEVQKKWNVVQAYLAVYGTDEGYAKKCGGKNSASQRPSQSKTSH